LLSVRACTEGDWAALKAVRIASLVDAPDAFGLTLKSANAYTDAQWRDRAAGRTVASYFLAFDGGRAIGLIGGHVDDKGEYNLIAMWVDPASRGTPAATMLVDRIKQLARERGHAQVVLAVSPDNLRAAQFYRKQGFAFLPDREPLDSNPAIMLQKMVTSSS
jgi:ribosomal protein S18 acetylase RimI-like enzyme